MNFTLDELRAHMETPDGCKEPTDKFLETSLELYNLVAGMKENEPPTDMTPVAEKIHALMTQMYEEYWGHDLTKRQRRNVDIFTKTVVECIAEFHATGHIVSDYGHLS